MRKNLFVPIVTAFAFAAMMAVAACTTTPSTTDGQPTVATGWSVQGAAAVELSATAGLETTLATIESQCPSAKATIAVAGKAIGQAVETQVAEMIGGSTAVQQSKSAAISVVLGAASAPISDVLAEVGKVNCSVPILADLPGFLTNEVMDAAPAVYKAVSNTATQADVDAQRAALDTALGKL